MARVCFVLLLTMACGKSTEVDGGTDAGLDAERTDSSVDATPEPCEPPGAVEEVACDHCGTQERLCNEDGFWVSGICEGAGVCEPGEPGALECGNCGGRRAVCNDACEWDADGPCMSEGECGVGESRRTNDGCPAGETRELECSGECAFEEVQACMPDMCETPGAIEMVSCGMCGQQERFCTTELVWTYGPCADAGVCSPGAIQDTACGMCGAGREVCSDECLWESFGACTDEGECEPGASTRTADGCPDGEYRTLECSDECALEVVEDCGPGFPQDVILLFDMTGSHATRVARTTDTIADELVAPLLGARFEDAFVGVAHYMDFPQMPYGAAGDVPFGGDLEPVGNEANVQTALAALDVGSGGDFEESAIEALDSLSGGAHPTTEPMTCSASRVSGGCWRNLAQRIVVLFTDAPNHNGPDPRGPGLFRPYISVSPNPAEWPDVSSALTTDGVELFVVLTEAASTDTTLQYTEMLRDLGAPASRLLSGSEAELDTTLGELVDALEALAP